MIQIDRFTTLKKTRENITSSKWAWPTLKCVTLVERFRIFSMLLTCQALPYTIYLFQVS